MIRPNQMRDDIRQFVSYAVIGGGGALLYVVCASLLHELGAREWLASFLSYLAFIPIIYFLQRRLTFRSSAHHGTAFPRYAAIQTFGLLLAAALPALFAGFGFRSPTASFMVVAVTIAVVNFGLSKFWAFRDR